MADNEELNESTEELIEMFKELERQGKLNTDDLKKLSQTTSKMEKAGESAKRGLSNLTNAALQFGSAMTKGGDEFGTLQSTVQITGNLMSELAGAVPLVGGALKALGKAATAAAGIAIDRLQVSFNAFQELSQQGLIGAKGMSGLREQMVLAQVPMEKFSKMMSKSSEDLAFLSGSAMHGGTQFAEVVARMQDGQGLYLRRLGFSIEEIGETVVDFQKTHRILGIQQQMTTQELAVATTKYGKELDMIAKITGQQRKEVQKNRDQMMANTRFAAWQSQQETKYGKERTLAVADFIGGIRKLSPMMAEGMTDLFASGGVATTEAGRRMMQQGLGDTVMRIRNAMLSGSMDMATARRELFKSALQNRDRFRDLSALVGDFGAGIPFQEMRNMAAAAGMNEEQIKELEKAQKGQMSGQDKMTDAVTKTVLKLQQAQVMFDDFVLSGDVATTVVDTFSDGLLYVAETLYGMAGKDKGAVRSMMEAKDEAVKARRMGVKGQIIKEGSFSRFVTGEKSYKEDINALNEATLKVKELSEAKKKAAAEGKEWSDAQQAQLEKYQANLDKIQKRVEFQSTHRKGTGVGGKAGQDVVLQGGREKMYSGAIDRTVDTKINEFMKARGWTEQKLRSMTEMQKKIIQGQIKKAEKRGEKFDANTYYGFSTGISGPSYIGSKAVSAQETRVNQYLALRKKLEEDRKKFMESDGGINKEEQRKLDAYLEQMNHLAKVIEGMGNNVVDLVGKTEQQTRAIKQGNNQ